jgi:hypothetical protein
MFKSKHSGWTWELKRTPFGGGGGGFFSDPFQSIGNALASIDPGPAIGSGLASVDKAVNNLTPMGWALPAALAAAYLTAGGSLAAEGATTAGEAAYSEAIASGASEAEATAAADAAAQSAAAEAGVTATPGADSVISQPDVAVNLGATNGGTVGSLNPALPAAGAPAGTSVGLSGALAPGTVLGTGLPGGGAIGASYAAGGNGLPATDFFGNYIPASSINTGGVPNTIAGTTATTTNTNSDLAKLLKQGAGSGLSSSLGKLAQGSNVGSVATTPWVHGNQNPFVQTQNLPIQNTPKLDVASLANLLKQG